MSASYMGSIYGFSSCELVSRHVMYICKRNQNRVYNVLYFMLCLELSDIYIHLHCGRTYVMVVKLPMKWTGIPHNYYLYLDVII